MTNNDKELIVAALESFPEEEWDASAESARFKSGFEQMESDPTEWLRVAAIAQQIDSLPEGEFPYGRPVEPAPGRAANKRLKPLLPDRAARDLRRNANVLRRQSAADELRKCASEDQAGQGLLPSQRTSERGKNPRRMVLRSPRTTLAPRRDMQDVLFDWLQGSASLRVIVLPVWRWRHELLAAVLIPLSLFLASYSAGPRGAIALLGTALAGIAFSWSFLWQAAGRWRRSVVIPHRILKVCRQEGIRSSRGRQPIVAAVCSSPGSEKVFLWREAGILNMHFELALASINEACLDQGVDLRVRESSRHPDIVIFHTLRRGRPEDVRAESPCPDGSELVSSGQLNCSVVRLRWLAASSFAALSVLTAISGHVSSLVNDRGHLAYQADVQQGDTIV